MPTPPSPTLPAHTGAVPAGLDIASAALAALWAAMVPLSAAGTNVLLLPLLLLLAFRARALWAVQVWRLPPVACALLLFAWIALRAGLDAWQLSATANVGPAQARFALAQVLSHYRELWLGAVLAALALASPRARRALWWGLLAGVLMVAVREAWFWWRDWYAVPKRISAGFTFALAAYACAWWGRAQPPRCWARRLLWLAAATFAALALFIVKGRSGHVLLALLGLALAAQWLQGKARWVGLAAVLLALAAAFALSPAVRERTLEASSDLARYQRGDVDSTNSMGQRFELWRNATALAQDAPLFGQGYARYKQQLVDRARTRYRSEPGRAHWADNADIVKDNPHQEYLLQWGAGGLPGLALLLALFAAPWLWRRPATHWPLQALRGIALAMACGCLFNSFLLDFTEGHVFMLLLALLTAEQAGDSASADARAGSAATAALPRAP